MLPAILGGSVIEMLEGWFGEGGSNSMVTALEACTAEIIKNIHDIESRLRQRRITTFNWE